MKISKFNVNRSKSDFCFKTATFVSDGLMSADDHKLLHSLKEMTGKNIEQINVVGPDLTEISPKFNSAKEKLAEQNDKLTRLYYLTESQGYCGRVWDESSASPTAKTYCGNLTMLQNLPELLGLGGYLVQNDHNRRKLSPTNHYFFEDGSEAKLDGSMGHYQWGWNKPFYITIWRDNNLHYECVSFEPIKGRESYYVPIGSMSCAGFAAIDRETDTLVSYVNDSPRYRGGNDNADWDDDPVKTLLCKPVSNKNIYYYISAAHKNGEGWYAGTMRMRSVLTVLLHIIMGTRKTQADFNPVKNSDGLYSCGFTLSINNVFVNYKGWSDYNDQNPIVILNENIEFGDALGTFDMHDFTYVYNDKTYTSNPKMAIFYGLKNFYGGMWRVNEDECVKVIDNEIIYHIFKKSLYDESYVFKNETDSVKIGSNIRFGRGNIKNVSYKNLELFPIEYDINDVNTYMTYYSSLYSISSMNAEKWRMYFNGGYSYLSNSNTLTCSFDAYQYTIHNRDCTYLCEFTEDFLLEPIVT